MVISMRTAIRNNLEKEWAEILPSEQCFDYNDANLDKVLRYCHTWHNYATIPVADSHYVRDHLIDCVRCRFVYSLLSGWAKMTKEIKGCQPPSPPTNG